MYIIPIASILSISCSDMINKSRTPELYLGLTQSIPSPSGSMKINNGAAETTTYPVTLQINILDAAEMRFSNNGTSWSEWEPFSATKNWTMAGYGKKSVFGQFRDVNGNILQATASINIFIEGKITASDSIAGDRFGGTQPGYNGGCVAASSDGTIFVAGAWSAGSQKGVAYVYRWSGGAWSEFKLTASDAASPDQFGYHVASSHDGGTIVVGAWGSNGIGKAYVYKWNGTDYGVWNSSSHHWDENFKFVPSTTTLEAFGVSVAISGDGNIIAVGAYHSLSYKGSVYVFRWNGSAWLQTTVAPQNTSLLGIDVSLSDDGNALLAGGSFANLYLWNGSTYGVWNPSTSHYEENYHFPVIGGSYCVALSGDGNTAVVGTAYTDSNKGAVTIYRNNGGTWISAPIMGSDIVAGDQFGYNLSTSGDGNTVICGAPAHTVNGKVYQGAAYIFKWSGTAWSEWRKISSSDGLSGDWFGISAIMSDDGETFFVGAPAWNSQQGAVYIY